jgi:hypothetical protein
MRAQARRLRISGALACVVGANIQVAAQDFNGNGVADPVDLRNGTAPDCNHNGIPHECEPPPCPPGDVDCDGATDGIDLVLVLGHWGSADLATDLNDDGVVDAMDLVEVVAH